MLPAAAAEPFDSPAHIFEVLWDGLRVLAFIEGSSVRLQDQYGRDITDRYPELGVLSAQVEGTGVVLDGVIVSLDLQGKPDFSALRQRLAVDDLALARTLAAAAPVSYQTFDILYSERRPLLENPLHRRKGILHQLLRTGGPVGLPDCVERDGVAFFDAARDHGLEGIVAKERHSPYLPGRRSRSWLKITIYSRGEFVVGGFTYGGRWKTRRRSARRVPLQSLLLGLYDEAGLFHYVGEVAAEFDEDPDSRLIDRLVTRRSPFAEEPPLTDLVFWCRPELSVTVRYAEWTPQRRLRFPVFEAFRPDVPADSRRLEPGP